MHAARRCPLPDHDPPGQGLPLKDAPRVSPRLASALVDATHDALFAVDADLRLVAWTWGAENLYGFTPPETVGRNALDMLVPQRGQEEFRAAVQECQSTGSAFLECVRKRRDGGEVQVQSMLKWVRPAGPEAGFVAISDTDVTEARRLESELSQQVWSLTDAQEFLKSVLDASTDYSIIALDLEGCVVAWNAGARYDFGYELEVVRDRPLAALVGGPSPADHDALVAALQSCLVTGNFEAEMEMTRRDRRTFPARVSLTVRKDAFGAAAGYVLIAKDLTEERRAEDERRVALERLLEIRRLGEVDKIKTALLNTTSHELATPLTPIKVQLHLLKSAPADRLDAPLRKAVETLDRNFGRLAQVVQGMVDVVRLQGGVKLDLGAADLAAIARGVVADNRAAAEAAGIRLLAVAPAPIPIAADAVRLQQVAQHLVANALRFTPKDGQVTVEAEALLGRVEMRVRDTGRGLTPDQMERLFQPFGQVHDTSQETKGGIGVGLYICKALVEAHGGRIRVASDGPGRGCVFSFDLPSGAL